MARVRESLPAMWSALVPHPKSHEGDSCGRARWRRADGLLRQPERTTSFVYIFSTLWVELTQGPFSLRHAFARCFGTCELVTSRSRSLFFSLGRGKAQIDKATFCLRRERGGKRAR